MAVVEIEVLPLGPLETNCLIVRSGDDCWVVDPGMWPEALLRFFQEAETSPSRIVLTHGHGDHIAGVGELIGTFPHCPLTCPADDAYMLSDPGENLSMAFGISITAKEPDRLIRPGDELECGRSVWHVLDTSGHTPGGVSLYCPEASAVLTGDALFAGSIGRTDVPRSDGARLVRNIRDHLLTLPNDTKVYPGHGPTTTIGREKRLNPFLGGA